MGCGTVGFICQFRTCPAKSRLWEAGLRKLLSAVLPAALLLALRGSCRVLRAAGGYAASSLAPDCLSLCSLCPDDLIFLFLFSFLITAF